jgi:hypothetical protein
VPLYLHPALPVSSQDAGDRTESADGKDVRISKVVRQVAAAVYLGTDPEDMRDAVEDAIQAAEMKRASCPPVVDRVPARPAAAGKAGSDDA